MGPLGAQVPSLARGVPTPSLVPRRTHASLDKRLSASMGLGHMEPGCEQLASVAANPQTPPSSHHHCDDLPVLTSVKGSPFTVEEQGGGRQEMAFVRAGAGWFRVNTRGPHAHPGARPQASLRATCPTLEISGQVPSVLDSSPCKRKASLPPGGPRIFPRATLPSSSPAPTEA